MSVLPSLIAALERAAGDCLVLRSGERPHVMTGETRHDVGTTVLSAKAVEALASQILSPESQKELQDRSSAQEVLAVEVAEGSLTARAERAGDEIFVELRRHRRAPKPNAVEAALPLAVSEAPATAAAPAGTGAALPVATPEPPTAGLPIPVAIVTAPKPEAVEPPARTVEPPAAVAVVQPAATTQFVVERFEPVAVEAPVAPAPAIHEPQEAPVANMDTVAPQEVVSPLTVAAPAPAAAAPASRPSVVPVHAPAAGSARDLTDDLDELIADAAERGATALYLRAGQVPAARIDERLQPLDDAVVSAATLKDIIASCTGAQDGWTAGEHGEWVREFDLAGLVKCYPFSDHAGDGVVLRLSPRSSATGLQRHVPRQVRRSCEAEDGLVLVAAPAQSDLLAMIAAVADLAARKRAGYVICLEPAEGLPHPVAGAFVSERKLAGSAADVTATVRRAVQEAPDVLVVGSVDAPVALEEVVRYAAAPGRLVILGVVAPTALMALESVLGRADREREPYVRKTLAASIRAAFGYRGLRRLGGGRTTVQDVIVATGDVRARLERADFVGIEQAQRQGGDGMRTLDAALARAVARRQVSLRHAAAHATNKAELVALTRRDARERRAVARGQRPEWRQGVLRAI